MTLRAERRASAELGAEAEAAAAVSPLTIKLSLVGATGLVFFGFMAVSSFWSYEYLWLEHVGVSATSRGAIALYTSLGKMASSFYLGYIADVYQAHLLVFSIATFFWAAPIYVMTAYPDELLVQFAGTLIYSLATIGNLGFAILQKVIEYVGQKGSLGKVRAFGSLAQVLANPVFGYLQGHYGLAAVFRYAFGPCAALSLVMAYMMPVADAYGYGKEQDNKPQAPKRDMSTVCKMCSPFLMEVLIFFFMVGIAQGLNTTFEFIYLEKELDVSGVYFGYSLTAQMILEIPFFLVAGSVVEKLGGILPTCYFVTALYFIRFGIGNALVAQTFWQIVPFELIASVTFVLQFTVYGKIGGSPEYAEMQATMFALMGFATAFGGLVGGSAAGFLADQVSLRTMFAIMSTPMAVFVGLGIISLPFRQSSTPSTVMT